MSTGRSTTTRDQHRAAIRRTKPACGICSGEIDYSLRSPDPMSFEVDHVVPLARGGTDTLDNAQASHRACNRAKWHGVPEVARTFATARNW